MKLLMELSPLLPLLSLFLGSHSTWDWRRLVSRGGTEGSVLMIGRLKGGKKIKSEKKTKKRRKKKKASVKKEKEEREKKKKS